MNRNGRLDVEGNTMRAFRFWVATAALALATPSFADTAKKPAPTKTPAKTPAKTDKAPAPKKVVPVPVSADHKKQLAALLGGFKLGMSKDDVLKMLGKHLDEEYEERIKQTTDIAAQDRLRKEKKTALAAITKDYTEFKGTKTSWDVSIIEGEFAHNTGEAMFDRWENSEGKNNRRFFFFRDGKLWKMFLSLDVSILPEDKRNFDTLKQTMTGKYGNGNVDENVITWYAGEFDVRAVDKLKIYSGIGLAIEDTAVKRELVALRESKAEKKPETSPVIKSVLDSDKTDHPDVKQNSNAVDDVIKAQGGGTKPKK
jgi:hypothetical protein